MNGLIRVGRAAALTAAAGGLLWAAAYCAEPAGDEQGPDVASIVKQIPAGYRFYQGIRGDLNGDGADDEVIFIAATDKKKIVRDDNGRLVDRNRRGIMIFFNNGGSYKLVLENRQCFSSDDEDGGNNVPPDLEIKIEKGNLKLHYAHGRKGYWTYTFRYRNSDFELIGYDASGQYEERTISMNFLTKKQLVKTCIRKDNEEDCADCCSEKYKETWSDITIKEPVKLRKIVDFDEFYIDEDTYRKK